MKFRGLMLATTAIAVAGAAGQAQASNWYVSVFGGANWVDDESASDRLTSTVSSSTFVDFAGVDLESETGFVVGGTVGYHLDSWVKGLRAEVEVSYRRNRVGGDWITWTAAYDNGSQYDGSTVEGVINGHVSNFAIMANAWWDFNIGGKVKPYIGGGIGWARAKIETVAAETSPDSSTNDFDDEHSGFAYQLGAGFNYEVMPDVSVGLGYRYFKGPDLEFDFFGPGDSEALAHVDVNNDNHSVFLSLTVDIN